MWTRIFIEANHIVSSYLVRKKNGSLHIAGKDEIARK